jgi:hypothetical protein
MLYVWLSNEMNDFENAQKAALNRFDSFILVVQGQMEKVGEPALFSLSESFQRTSASSECYRTPSSM